MKKLIKLFFVFALFSSIAPMCAMETELLQKKQSEITEHVIAIINRAKITQELQKHGITVHTAGEWEKPYEGIFEITLSDAKNQFIGRKIFKMLLDPKTLTILPQGTFMRVDVDPKFRLKGYRTQLILLAIRVFIKFNVTEREYTASPGEKEIDLERLITGYAKFGPESTHITKDGVGYKELRYVVSITGARAKL